MCRCEGAAHVQKRRDLRDRVSHVQKLQGLGEERGVR